MKLSQIIKTLANLNVEEVLAKIDKQAAETQATIADVPQALSVFAKVTGRTMQHQANTFCLIGEGLADMSTSLREPKPEEDSSGSSWEAFNNGPDIDESQMVYIIEGSDDDVTTYYGPVDYARACLMVNSIKGNVDVTRGVPTEALPIEVLLEKQSAQLRKKLSK